MVQTGISRAYGNILRQWIGQGMRNPLTAALAGVGVTVLLQSSTATALLMTSFASRGIIETAPALAVLLGADVGTTLVAQIFTLNLSWLAPLLVLVGVVLYRNSNESERQEVARAAIGLGLMLVALRQIVTTSEPLRESVVLPAVLPSLQGDLLVLALIGALLAWLAHSSLATVLLVITLVSTGVISLEVAFALVLGLNVGGVFPAVVATLGKPVPVRRLPMGNLIFKLCGAVVMLPLLGRISPLMVLLGGSPARQVANFHTLFNLTLAVVFLFLTPMAARLMARLLPDEPQGENPEEPHYLDPSLTRTPSVAIVLAEQETLRMGDVVETMFRRSLEVFRTDNRRLLAEIERMDDVVDALNESIKLYLTKVSREPMSERDSRRIIEIITFATNLEHVGDIVDKNLMELAAKKIRGSLRFSEEGMADIARLHDELLAHFALAFNVFMTGNVELARSLMAEKEAFRDQERQAAEAHLERLRRGKMESIDTSSIHLDILRDLKRINSHITAVVYPLLDQAGQLFSSRLKERS
jgi:phosphate:Na+ symporter